MAVVREFDDPILQIAVAPGGQELAVALERHNNAPGRMEIIDAASGTTTGRIDEWNGGSRSHFAIRAMDRL